MRTKLIKINKVPFKCVLLCGVSGLVKVYGSDAVDGFILNFKGAQGHVVGLTTVQHGIVSNFVNLKYLSIEHQSKAQSDFIDMCELIKADL